MRYKKSGKKSTNKNLKILGAFFIVLLLFGLLVNRRSNIEDNINKNLNQTNSLRQIEYNGESSLFIILDESYNLNISVNPAVTDSDILQFSFDESIINVSNINHKKRNSQTEYTITINAKSEGKTILDISAPSVSDDKISINIEVYNPIIKSFPNLTIAKTIEQTDSIIYTGAVSEDITTDDFNVSISDESVIEVSNIGIIDNNGKSSITFTLTGKEIGSAKVKLISSDGYTESNSMTVTVVEKDTSRTVYVTYTGQKYHYSSSCAGDNCRSTTLNKAINAGYDPCSKCVK